MRNVVIACGGTGGHLTPGIALAQSLEEKGCPSWLFISQKGVDSRLSSKYPNLSFVPLPGAPLIKSPFGLARFCHGFAFSFLRSHRFYKKVGADALVVVGGNGLSGPSFVDNAGYREWMWRTFAADAVGVTIDTLGMVAGMILGFTFLFFRQGIVNAIQFVTGQNLWDPSIRFLTELPSQPDPVEIATICIMALVFSFLATLYPAFKAANTDPVQVLRYE